MKVIRNKIFKVAHQIMYPSFIDLYKQLKNNEYSDYDTLVSNQEKRLKTMLEFSFQNVPYYNKMFQQNNISINDIKTIDDLNIIPIIDKSIVRDNYQDLIPSNQDPSTYYVRKTGGSTGTPLEYLLSKSERFLSTAIWYRGWGYADYQLGDKMFFLGGSSLGTGVNSKLLTDHQ